MSNVTRVTFPVQRCAFNTAGRARPFLHPPCSRAPPDCRLLWVCCRCPELAYGRQRHRYSRPAPPARLLGAEARATNESVPRRPAALARDRFVLKQLGCRLYLGLAPLSPAATVRRRSRLSAALRGRCHAVRHSPGSLGGIATVSVGHGRAAGVEMPMATGVLLGSRLGHRTPARGVPPGCLCDFP